MNCTIIIAAIYGTLVSGNMVKAPSTIIIDNRVHVTSFLSETQANALGYKLVKDEPPSCASNEYAVAIGWSENERIHRTYKKYLVVPPPRRWTPRSIKKSALAIGCWDALKAFLIAAGAYDDFIMAHYEAEDDEQFIQLMAAARQQFGDAVVEAILNGAEVEP